MKKIFYSLLALLAVVSASPVYALIATPLNQGGTGLSTSTAGDLLVGTSSISSYSRLPIGTGILTASTTAPFKMVWAATSTLGIPSFPLSLANGGWGCPNGRTQVTTNGSITALAVPTCWINFNTSIGASILGITAQPDGTEIVLTNEGSSLVIGHQNTGATASNRIIVPASVNLTVPFNTSIRLRYDGSQSRWVFVGGYNLATTGQAGLLSASDKVLVDTITGKLTGSGAAGRVTFYSNNANTTSDSLFTFNSINKLFGVGTASPSATGHFSASTASTISALASANATLTVFTPLAAPGYIPSQSTPHLNRSSGFSASEISGTSPYNAGDTIEYQLWALSGGTYSVVYSYTSVSINSNSNNVNISWADDSSGSATTDSYLLTRSINGGGYADGYNVGLVTGITDDGTTGWSSYSISPQFPDFVANGSTRNYTAYSKSIINGTEVFSPSGTTQAFTDNNDGSAFSILHTVTSGGTTARVLNTDNTTYADGLSFTEYTNFPFSAGNTVTPSTYGSIANGSTWNKTYDFYNYSAPLGIYSSTYYNQSTVDPNDGQYYYAVLDFTGKITSAKIIRDTSSSETSATSPIYDNGSSGWSGDTVVTPNSIYPSAGLFEGNGTSLSDMATVVMRSLSGSFANLQFQNSSSASLGNLFSSTTGMFFDAVSGKAGNLSYLGSSKLKWDTNGITISSLTAGRIPYAGTAGLISDTSNFVWDNSNIRHGIGTSTPIGTLSVQGGSIPFVVATSTNSNLFRIDSKGHSYYGGEAPSISSCGTSPSLIAGNDSVGRVQVGSVVATACTITFARAWDAPPICDANIEGGLTVFVSASSTPSSVVITGASAITGGVITYQCFGIKN